MGNTTRFIPIYVTSSRMGIIKCNILPSMHSLTGSDCTSKLGTKAAVIKMLHPEIYLSEIGTDPDHIDFAEAEIFLVQLLKPGTSFKTIDECRYFIYH